LNSNIAAVARASRLSQHLLPKYDLYEKAITKSFYGTLGGAVSMPLHGVPEILHQERSYSAGITSKLWNRISSLVTSVTSSLFDWATKHTQVVIWIAGLAFVVSAGVIVYSSWIAPQVVKGFDLTDEQDTSAMQASTNPISSFACSQTK